MVDSVMPTYTMADERGQMKYCVQSELKSTVYVVSLQAPRLGYSSQQKSCLGKSLPQEAFMIVYQGTFPSQYVIT